jgi:hypothetical protein
MDVIVGHDLTAHGDDALLCALRLAALEPDLEIGVVHVVSQADLEQTGELSTEDKRRVAVERAFPTVWRRIEELCDQHGLSTEGVELDVHIRVAAVHLARSQEAIADHLLQTAADHGAKRLVMGRHGRPGCVAEHVLGRGTRQGAPEGAPPGAIVVQLSAPT